MQNPTTSHAVEATRVWGIEVMDPLEQWAWAQNLWQRLSTLESHRSLLLSYAPSAERAALRGLTALTRLAREAGWAVHHFAPGFLPVLPEVELLMPSLLLVHHGSRFVNMEEWMTRIAVAPRSRIVLTAPAAEIASLSGIEKFDRVPVPEEEPVYCERQAEKILEKFFVNKTQPGPVLESLEPILIEAGVAEVSLPLALLARHVHLDDLILLEKLHASRLHEFIWYPSATPDKPCAVAFRGRWLAEKMAQVSPSPFPHLLALLNEADPTLPVERYFVLNLLMAMRCREDFTTAENLLRDYYDLFHEAALLSEPQERHAWGFFHTEFLRSILRS